jgi:hypothetical protein
MKISAPFSVAGVAVVSITAFVMVFAPIGLGLQRCAATLSVGETGVASARAAGAEGDHPACTSGFLQL